MSRPSTGQIVRSFADEAEGYLDLKVNGQLFFAWIAENFGQYRLDEIVRRTGEDPCDTLSSGGPKTLRKYQEFLGQYMSINSPYLSILLYHGMGSGKTATVINSMNVVYQADPNTNFILLIKASLLHDPWMKDLEEWAMRSPDEAHVKGARGLRMVGNIRFIHYDSPHAGRDF